jgi:Transcriptional regulatory protein, C terminal
VFDLLVYLVRNRGRVVSKDDLIDSVWGGRIVSDSALTTRLNAVRKAVDDSGAAQRVIRTVHRKGVRFICEVSEGDEPVMPFELTPPVTDPPIAPRLSIVVLPFANLSRDPEQQYFADGITGDLTTDLSRIPDMLVIRATLPSPTGVSRSTRSRSAASLGCAICSKETSSSQQAGFASPPS